MSFLDAMKVKNQRGALWLNDNELEKKKHRKIKEALLGDDQLFDLLGINKKDIPRVQQFEWMIDGEQYDSLQNLEVSRIRVMEEKVGFKQFMTIQGQKLSG